MSQTAHYAARDNALRRTIQDAAETTDREPSEAAKQAGNFRKGSFMLRGLRVVIETPAGAYRRGVSKDGRAWAQKMPWQYGYLSAWARRPDRSDHGVQVSAADGDNVDVFVGPDPESELVFVVDQQRPDGSFDEHKILAGWNSEAEARAGYLAAYPSGWTGLKAITPMTWPEFREWLHVGHTGGPVATYALTCRFDELIAQYSAEFESQHPRGQPANAGEFAKKPKRKAKQEDKQPEKPARNPYHSLADFADVVNEMAAKAPAEDKFHDNKAFIEPLWRASQRDETFPFVSLAWFKSKLLDANAKGLLHLSRADMVSHMDREQVKNSEINVGYGQATFHFVRLPDEKATYSIKPAAGQRSMAFDEEKHPRDDAGKFTEAHHAVAKRFDIPVRAVKDLVETPPDELARRDKYVPPSNTEKPTTDFEKFPLHSARIDSSRHGAGETEGAYVDYLREFDPKELKPTEHEDGIKKTQHFQDYLKWAKEGKQAPYVNVYSDNNGSGKLLSSNRRRTLAAQDAGLKSITGWHGPYNKETGNPLKYGDVMKAHAEASKPNKHGPNSIPESDISEVRKLLKAGEKTAASLKLESLAEKHKLKSYEVHHLASKLKSDVATYALTCNMNDLIATYAIKPSKGQSSMFGFDAEPAAPHSTKWDESKHPRGQPENAGEFVKPSEQVHPKAKEPTRDEAIAALRESHPHFRRLEEAVEDDRKFLKNIGDSAAVKAFDRMVNEKVEAMRGEMPKAEPVKEVEPPKAEVAPPHTEGPVVADEPPIEEKPSAPAEEKLDVPAEALPTLFNGIVADKIADFGERIEGARKHTARPLGKRTADEKEKDDRPAWMRRYRVAEDAKRPGEYFIVDEKKEGGWSGRRNLILDNGKNFTNKEDAENAIPLVELARTHAVGHLGTKEECDFVIYRKVSDRKHPVVKRGFATYEDAQKYMAGHPTEIIEHKFPDWEEYRYLDNVTRTGPEFHEGDVTPSDFQKAFNFRGGQFGNWNTGKDGQTSLNHAYDAFHDLADALGLPAKATALNGDLAIAFGARGTGGKGSAAAHYEPDQKIINLTKMKGAGTLSHEWGHAFDSYLGKAAGTRGYYLTSSSPSGNQLRTEVIDAMKGVKEAITTRETVSTGDVGRETKTHDNQLKHLGEYIGRLENGLKPTEYRKTKPFTPAQQKEWDVAKASIMGGDFGKKTHVESQSKFSRMGGYQSYDNLEKLNKLYKASTGRSFHTTDSKSTGNEMYWQMWRVSQAEQALKDAKSGIEKKGRGRSNFMNESLNLDQTSVGDYYSEPEEMFARAFEAYVQDKLESKGRKSQYLVARAHNKHYAMLGMKPYPEGEERTAINSAFDKLFEAVKHDKRSDEKGEHVRLYSLADDVDAVIARYASLFNEDDHPRGQPNNAGQFIEVAHAHGITHEHLPAGSKIIRRELPAKDTRGGPFEMNLTAGHQHVIHPGGELSREQESKLKEAGFTHWGQDPYWLGPDTRKHVKDEPIKPITGPKKPTKKPAAEQDQLFATSDQATLFGKQAPRAGTLETKQPEKAAPDFHEMVRIASGYQFHGMNAEPEEKNAWREHSRHMTKSALDKWLMKKYGIDEVTARAVSNKAGEMNAFETTGSGTREGEHVKWTHKTKVPTLAELGDVPWGKTESPADAFTIKQAAPLPAQKAMFSLSGMFHDTCARYGVAFDPLDESAQTAQYSVANIFKALIGRRIDPARQSPQSPQMTYHERREAQHQETRKRREAERQEDRQKRLKEREEDRGRRESQKASRTPKGQPQAQGMPANSGISQELHDEAHAALVAMGHKPKEVGELMNRLAASGKKYDTMQDVLREVYKPPKAAVERTVPEGQFRPAEKPKESHDKPRAESGKDRWITIGSKSGHGTHVKIDGEGTITAGPKALEGHDVDNLPDRSQTQPAKPKALPTWEAFHQAQPAPVVFAEAPTKNGQPEKPVRKSGSTPPTLTTPTKSGQNPDRSGHAADIDPHAQHHSQELAKARAEVEAARSEAAAAVQARDRAMSDHAKHLQHAEKTKQHVADLEGHLRNYESANKSYTDDLKRQIEDHRVAREKQAQEYSAKFDNPGAERRSRAADAGARSRAGHVSELNVYRAAEQHGVSPKELSDAVDQEIEKDTDHWNQLKEIVGNRQLSPAQRKALQNGDVTSLKGHGDFEEAREQAERTGMDFDEVMDAIKHGMPEKPSAANAEYVNQVAQRFARENPEHGDAYEDDIEPAVAHPNDEDNVPFSLAGLTKQFHTAYYAALSA